VSFLPAKALHFCQCHSTDSQLTQRFAHIIGLKGFDDRNYQFHGGSPGQLHLKAHATFSFLDDETHR
jgi:hypothetical protein